MKVRYQKCWIAGVALMSLMMVTKTVSAQDNPPPRRGSQIIDDSTKNVYGPKTTLWISEQELFYNKTNYKPLDTSIVNFHRWTYTQRLVNFYHDLGNVGTALNPVFPFQSSGIGASSGFRAYDPYFDSQEPKYYNSKSPYTRFGITWGGDGRALTEVEFTRNINPRWNFGFNYRPILADKQIQRRRKGDRQTISHYYDFHTSFKSKNERYLLLANYRRLRHRVNENGGILLPATNPSFESYFDQNAQPYLVAAQTEDLKSYAHLFHQYQLAKPFQLYQTVDITKQKNGYIDDLELELNDYYLDNVVSPGFDSLKISNSSFFRTFQSEMGIKGNAAFLFYNFYYKIRSFDNYNRTLVGYDRANVNGVENYVGARMSLRYDSLNELSGHAEYLLDGNYKVQASLHSKWLDAELLSTLAKPGFIYQAYRGSHHFWVNQFNDVFSNRIRANLKIKDGRFEFYPGIEYINLSNYLYFKRDESSVNEGVIPVQSSGIQQLVMPEVKFSFRFLRHFYLRPQIIYSNLLQNDDGALQVPELFVNTQLAYENTIAKGNLQVQIGVEAHWRSEYYTMNYDPAIQQFYVQNTFQNPSYVLADLFFAGKLKRGRFFFKYHNVQKAFVPAGYLSTPGYRGMANILDFGFDLFLFD